MKMNHLHSTTGHLYPTPPFDFAKSLDFIKLFAPVNSEQAIEPLSLTKAVCVAGQTFAFRLNSVGTVEKPILTCRLWSEQAITPRAEAALIDRITQYLSLKDDLQPFYTLGFEDVNLAPIVRSWYGYHQVKFLTPFENACWAILSQRNPLSRARKMKQALIEKIGNQIKVDGTVYWAFPEPAQVTNLTVDELSSVISHPHKAQCLSAVAQAFREVDENFLRTADYHQVNAWLQSIKGIGEWSAEFVLIRGLGRMEHLAVTEKRLLTAASKVYGQGQLLSKTEVKHIAQRYDRYPGYWAHYLRIAA